ncbi:hypothetical protein CLIB1423_18S02146 [[Candida] railenensis]|uniref:UBX domain-containing protein n=1 Tax=[Candida] railenensis TaxID=45579 RepID=A0A9P0QSH5_9ASCO|nr:hypothetical protein CLIB1423_18S02146 [[Candida] railenensis]
MIPDIFGTSVQEAVSASLSQNKPLLAFLTNEQEISQEFILKFLYTEGERNETVVDKLRSQFVCIKLIQGSVEFGYFQQIFQNLEVPSFYFIEKGNLLDIVNYESNPTEFPKKLERLVRYKAGNRTGEQEARARNPGDVGSSSQLEAASPSAPASTHASSAPQPEATAPSAEAPVSAPMAPLAHSPAPSTSPATTPASDSKLQQQQQRYKKSKKEQNLETQRIRALLEADEKERRAKQREERSLKEFTQDKIEQAQPVTDKPKEKTSTAKVCKLSIKLFDGSSLIHDFLPTQTLSQVRDWLDRETEGGIIPNTTSSMPAFASPSVPQPTHYVFYRPVLPRITYTDDQEFKTLDELELCPRSALILKPIYEDLGFTKSYPNAKASGVISNATYLAKRVGNALFSFFDYGVDHIEEDLESIRHRAASPFEDSASERGDINDGTGRSSGSSNLRDQNSGVDEFFSGMQVQLPNNSAPNLVSFDNVRDSNSLTNLQDQSFHTNPNSPRIPPSDIASQISRSSTPMLSRNLSSNRFRGISTSSNSSNGAGKGEPLDKDKDSEMTYNGNSVGLNEKKDE